MRSLVTFITLLIAVAIFNPSHADAAGLQGTWRGAGHFKPSSGKSMRVRCVVNYSSKTSRVFSVRANCASSSGSIRQSGEVLKIRNSLFVGDFVNKQFSISGRVRVQVNGGSQTVTFSSDSGGGSLNLTRR